MKREVNIDGEMEFVRALSISTLATRAEGLHPQELLEMPFLEHST